MLPLKTPPALRDNLTKTKSKSMNTTATFPILTQALAYQLIEPARLNKFFAPFSEELAAAGILFPDHESTVPSPLEERDRERRRHFPRTDSPPVRPEPHPINGSYYDSI